jgi:hypothetical protein
MQFWPMPDVVSPEEAESEEDFIVSLSQRPGISERRKAFYKGHAEVSYYCYSTLVTVVAT